MRCFKVILPLLMILILTGCDPAPEQGDATEHNSAFIAPMEFYSFDSFENAIRTAIDTPSSEFASDDYEMDLLTTYYVPSYFENSLNLDAICVKKRYVCIYYYLEDLSEKIFSNEAEREAAIISNTVKFEWRRTSDAQLEMDALIEALSLTKIDDMLYYTDISLPESPQHVLSRSYYWIQNGQVFELMLPVSMLQSVPTTVSIESGKGLLDAVERCVE